MGKIISVKYDIKAYPSSVMNFGGGRTNFHESQLVGEIIYLDEEGRMRKHRFNRTFNTLGGLGDPKIQAEELINEEIRHIQNWAGNRWYDDCL